MTGTLINVVAIIAGSILGVLGFRNVPQRYHETVMQGIALVVLLIGFGMALDGEKPLIITASLAIGGVFGELGRLEDRLESFGRRLETRFGNGEDDGRFTRAFVTASLVYCVGALAIVGPIENGLTGRYDILLAKSMLDGTTAIFFASAMGPGVAFSAIPVLVYQGSIALLAGYVKAFLTDPMIIEMKAVGGLLITGIGLNMLRIVKIRVVNLLPGIFLAPLLVALAAWLGG